MNGQVTVRMVVLQINKEAFRACMGKSQEYPLYKHQPVIRAFSKAGKLYIKLKSGDVIRCGIDEVTLGW